MLTGSDFIGVDLFAGAGGLSLGAEMSNIDVAIAVEKDQWASLTYAHNHKKTKVICDDIKTIKSIEVPDDRCRILFGGPPCQGFSCSNQKTRNKNNPSNWLLKEFVRIARTWKPDWVVFENVCGFINTEDNLFLDELIFDFESEGYTCAWDVLNAANFGIPQKRMRFFFAASKHGHKLKFPESNNNQKVNVRDAIFDLPSLSNGCNIDEAEYRCMADNEYSIKLRDGLSRCTGNLVTKNSNDVLKRYRHVPPGKNWRCIPEVLMGNYKDRSRCHEGIYHRLNPDEVSITIGNYRKAMLIHPWEDRGLSVREAARIQSFPDRYQFKGSIGFQQQQVGNAVPPLLAKEVFSAIVNEEYSI